MNQFSRSELVFGKARQEKLKNARVILFGLGGVGGYTLEALARAGVGTIHIVDNDSVNVTNICFTSPHNSIAKRFLCFCFFLSKRG